MRPIYRHLKDAAIVPGALNISHGETMIAHDAAVRYAQTHPEARSDRRWQVYANRAGQPTPQSVRIRNMKERISILKTEGRVK